MIGKTLALVQRAFRVDARDFRSHLFRAGLAGFILWVMATMQLNQFSRTAPGRDLFGWVMWLNYWFVTVAGATFFASAITEEKEERTLSLLKMADIGPLAILMGKWLPRLTGAMFLILIQVPFTALAVTLGGVLWVQIWAAYVTLLAHLIMVGSMGLLASVYFSRTSFAVTTLAILLWLFHFLPDMSLAIANNTIAASSWGESVTYLVKWLCENLIAMRASTQLGSTMLVGFDLSVMGFQVASNVIAGALLFFISWLIFEPCTRNEVEPNAESAIGAKLRQLGRNRTKTRRVWDWPLIWKDFYYLTGGPVVNFIKLAAYFLFLGGFTLLVSGRNGPDLEEIGAVFFGWSIFIFIAEVAILSARIFRDELQAKTWPSLTLIPMSIPSIAYRKVMGASISLLPVLICFAFGATCMMEEFFEGLYELLTEPEAILFLSYFCLQVVLGVHISTLLSVSAKWAIWPLAVFVASLIVIMANVMSFSCVFALMFSGSGEEGVILVFSMLTAGIILAVHVMIGRKLSELATGE